MLDIGHLIHDGLTKKTNCFGDFGLDATIQEILSAVFGCLNVAMPYVASTNYNP